MAKKRKWRDCYGGRADGLLPDDRRRMPHRPRLALLQCLQPPQTVARDLLRMLVALPFVVELQACELFGIHGLEIGSPERAVGCGLRFQQRLLRPASACFSLRMSHRGGLWVRMAGTTGNGHRPQYGGQDQKLRSKREAGAGRLTCARDAGVSCSKTGQVGRLSRAALVAARSSRSTSAWPPSQTSGRSWMENLKQT